VDAWADLCSTLNAAPHRQHALGVKLATRECRRNAVGEINHRLHFKFFNPLAPEKLDIVVRMKVEKTGQNRPVVIQLDNAVELQIGCRGVEIDREDASVRDRDPRIRANPIGPGVEQLPTANEQCLRPGYNCAQKQASRQADQPASGTNSPSDAICGIPFARFTHRFTLG
jgi:hypothetical protein